MALARDMAVTAAFMAIAVGVYMVINAVVRGIVAIEIGEAVLRG